MKFIVIKISGSIINQLASTTFKQIADLRSNGLYPIIVHDGGPKVNEALIENGIEAEYINGIRKINLTTLNIIANTLLCKVNVDVVEEANEVAQDFIGINGAYFPIFDCRPISKELGFVAEPENINREVFKQLCTNYIPVVASIGRYHNQFYSINAETLAYKIAATLQSPLIILSDIPGVQNQGEVISDIQLSELDKLINSKMNSDDMIPKLKDASKALSAGVKEIVIAPGYEENIMRQYFDGQPVGTKIY